MAVKRLGADTSTAMMNRRRFIATLLSLECGRGRFYEALASRAASGRGLYRTPFQKASVDALSARRISD
jgi:hypothetical protein